MKKTIILMALILSTSQVFADQAATLTCTGENIVLQVKSPYWGEDSDATQQLYVLKTTDSDETSYTAYFLDASYDVGPGGTIYISGKNEVGGSFDLVTNFPKDISDGTVIREISQGTLTYSHGPLKGEEAVTCIKE